MKRTARNSGAGGRARIRVLFTRVKVPALLWAAFFLWAPAPAEAMQILEAADHAELEAEISDRAVSRIALARDRIVRVIRGPDGFAVEHDAARGDLYLRPAGAAGAGLGRDAPRGPLTLFLGTASGFTYRLALTVADRGSAQILIRNAAAAPEPDLPDPGARYVGALVELVRAVARREVLAGYAIEAMPAEPGGDGLATVEIWRGARFTVRVLEAGFGPGAGAGSLDGRVGPAAAAVWLAPSGTGPSGGRLVVVVEDAFRTGPGEGAR